MVKAVSGCPAQLPRPGVDAFRPHALQSRSQPADFEQGEIGPGLFRHACLMGLEGLVSKHKDRPYRAGRSPHWVKVKNREHPAMERVMDTFS